MIHRTPPRNPRLTIALGVIAASLLIGLVFWWAQPVFVASNLSNLGRGDERKVQYAVEHLRSGSAMVRQAAARGMGRIGPQAKEAVPALLVALDDESSGVAAEAAAALGAIQAPETRVIDGLIEALNNKDGEVRRYAAYALSQYGAKARSAGPALTKLLRDEHMRYMAARALRETTSTQPDALEALTEMLINGHMGDRAEAAMTIADIKSLPESTVKLIEDMTSDKEDVVRRSATTALQKINGSKMAAAGKN